MSRRSCSTPALGQPLYCLPVVSSIAPEGDREVSDEQALGAYPMPGACEAALDQRSWRKWAYTYGELSAGRSGCRREEAVWSANGQTVIPTQVASLLTIPGIFWRQHLHARRELAPRRRERRHRHVELGRHVAVTTVVSAPGLRVAEVALAPATRQLSNYRFPAARTWAVTKRTRPRPSRR